jgi:RND family efflux transporter MFP subunit
VEWSPEHARFRAHGVVRARERAMLSFTVPGRLIARPVRVGDRVRAGTLLARIDRRGYDHGARAADASARQAATLLAQQQRDHERLAQLGEAKAVSREQLDRIRSAVEAAQASHEAAAVQRAEAERALRETELRAPFDGVVVSVHLEPGEFAGAGQPVLVLSGAGGLEVEVEVPGRVAERIVHGSAARIRFPLDAEGEYSAEVASVGASAGGPGRLFPVLFTFDAAAVPGVRPGSAAEITFETRAPKELTVPAGAVVAPSGVDAAVFRVRDGRAERVPVTLGVLHGERVAVRGELAAGDAIVVAGYTGLVPNEAVEVVP